MSEAKKRKVAFWCPPHLCVVLDDLAEATGLPVSQIVLAVLLDNARALEANTGFAYRGTPGQKEAVLRHFSRGMTGLRTIAVRAQEEDDAEGDEGEASGA